MNKKHLFRMLAFVLTLATATTTMAQDAATAQDVKDLYITTASVPMLQLSNGALMPQFGLGTYNQDSNETCKQSCLTALKAGYRHIDTAHAYMDEQGVGEAIKESGVPRNEIWLTSKLWPTEYGEGKTLKAISSLNKEQRFFNAIYEQVQQFGMMEIQDVEKKKW